MTFPALHLLPLGLCLAAAAVWDLASRRIPNWITGCAALSGVIVQVIDFGLWAALSGAAAGLLAIALLYRPWMAGGVGGGDVKMAGAVAIWIGLGGMIRYGLAVAAAGGLVALVSYILSKKTVRQEVRANLALAALHRDLPTVPRTGPGRVSVPYGLAIAAGAVFALWRP